MQHRARKRFGQNFLTDQTIIGQIVHAIGPKPDQLIVEIGPGQAALSRPLAESGATIQLLEIDRDLAAQLETRLPPNDRVKLHTVDALQADFAEITEGHAFRLVGNLPYNISTPLLFHVLQWRQLIVDMHFMLQQEVVKRMAAHPGSKAWGKLSIMCQLYCEVHPLFSVPPAAFSPPPRVQSSFVRLVPHESPPVEIPDQAAFQSLVSQAFSMRRKTLRNSLRGMLDSVQIESTGIDPGQRPETLSLEQFATLSKLLEKNR